ncbi:acylphosphatase [Candidatus Margulisiibacteriota bacterium]
MRKRLTLTYAGRLDEVDFRETAERFATAHKLTGHVKKFENGTVRVLVEGEEKELQKFMQDFNDDMDIFIEHFSKNWSAATGEYGRFTFLNI